MIIDANIFFGKSLHKKSVDERLLFSYLDDNHIDKAVIRPVIPFDYDYDRANREVAALQNAYPHKILAFGRVNPWSESAPALVSKIKEYGLTGIHLHPWEENFQINSNAITPVMDAIANAHLKVYVSTGYPCVSEALQLFETARKYPHVDFIATHGAQLDMSGLSFDDALLLADMTSNVYFDISGVYRRDFIELLLQHAGEDHVLFGSNAPYMDIALEMERIRATQISEYQKEKIFALNAEKLLFKMR